MAFQRAFLNTFSVNIFSPPSSPPIRLVPSLVRRIRSRMRLSTCSPSVFLHRFIRKFKLYRNADHVVVSFNTNFILCVLFFRSCRIVFDAFPFKECSFFSVPSFVSFVIDSDRHCCRSISKSILSFTRIVDFVYCNHRVEHNLRCILLFSEPKFHVTCFLVVVSSCRFVRLHDASLWMKSNRLRGFVMRHEWH